MDPTLIFVVPIGLVKLQVFPSVVNFPVRFKPTRLFQFFFKITENIFDVFHAVMKELKKRDFPSGAASISSKSKRGDSDKIFAGFEK